ncbi:MAG: hypothetical protein JRF37_07055 [Deltaproteobacteria bacterium]|nr:hypothetical protein [Deltaproteobacteria bacterium]
MGKERGLLVLFHWRYHFYDKSCQTSNNESGYYKGMNDHTLLIDTCGRNLKAGTWMGKRPGEHVHQH